MKTLIVIPTYNEALNIKNLILEIKNVLNGLDYGILVVDDSSADGTADIVKEFSDVFLLQRKGKLGFASAYVDGFKYGMSLGFDAFVQMDADFSHNPKYLKIMLEKLKDFDLVIGSRNIKGGACKDWSIFRYVISKTGSLYAKTILRCPICDFTGGFNAWRKEMLDKIDMDNLISKGFCFQDEMKYKAFKNGAKIAEFPIVFENRKLGKSKANFCIFFEFLINILKLKFSYSSDCEKDSTYCCCCD